MKGCILLQGNNAKIGQALALHLKKNHGVTEFCAYVISPRAKNFVYSQTDLTYTRILVDQEIHEKFKDEIIDFEYLQDMEKKFGEPNLWRYIYTDRRITMSHSSVDIETMILKPLYSHEDILKIVQVRLRETIAFLEKERPDFILFFSIGIIGTMLLYHIAKKMGIKVLVLDSVRLGQKMSLSEDFNTITGLKELFAQIKNGYASPHLDEAREILKGFKETGSLQLGYAIAASRPSTISLRARLRTYATIFKVYQTEKKMSFYDQPSSLYNFFKNKVIEKARQFRGYDDLYTPSNWNEDFAFFPLQYEPETSLLNIAPFYSDQIMVIKAVARSLPLHFKLYVKEHPAMVTHRTRAYYQELLTIPNVRLIPPYIKSFEVLKNTKLVTTITGTAGWEGALFGKPVITFGNVFYNEIPGVCRCYALENLPEMVREQLSDFTYHEEEIVQFLAALLENGAVDCSYFNLERAGYDTVIADKGLQKLATLLAEKI